MNKNDWERKRRVERGAEGEVRYYVVKEGGTEGG